MVKWGACGHPLREKRVVVGSDGSTAIIRTYPPWCQVCATADDTTEASNARALKAKSLTFTMKVTGVTPAPPGTYGPGDYGPDSFGGSDFPEVADVSGFVPGMVVDIIDGSGLRAEERARWRGREQEANAWLWNEENALISVPVATPAAQHAVEQTLRALRARDVVDVVLLTQAADAEAFNLVRRYLAEAYRGSQVEPGEWWREDGDAADKSVGHRHRAVDEVAARLCPPASRGWDFHGDKYRGLPMPRRLLRVLCEGAGIPQRYTGGSLGDLVAQHAPEAYAAAINQTSPLISGGFNAKVKSRKGKLDLKGVT